MCHLYNLNFHLLFANIREKKKKQSHEIPILNLIPIKWESFEKVYCKRTEILGIRIHSFLIIKIYLKLHKYERQSLNKMGS